MAASWPRNSSRQHLPVSFAGAFWPRDEGGKCSLTTPCSSTSLSRRMAAIWAVLNWLMVKMSPVTCARGEWGTEE